VRAQTLPLAAGLRWIATGFVIFRRNPPIMALLVIIYWFTLIFLNVLPLVGTLAVYLIVPGLSVGLMQVARNLDRGQPAGLQTLFGGLRENSRTLIALGALYLFCTFGSLGLSALLDGGDLFNYMLASNKVERAAVEDADLTLSVLFVSLLLLPVMMAYWFAPVLAAWHRLPLGKSLFFSFIACWLNWRPFLAYGLGLLLVAGIIPGVLLGILLLIFPGAQAFMTSIVIVPLALIIAPAIFASFYAAYRDIFGISEIV
jgi:hypothetical protein